MLESKKKLLQYFCQQKNCFVFFRCSIKPEKLLTIKTNTQKNRLQRLTIFSTVETENVILKF